MTRVPLLLAGQEVGQVPIVNKDLLQHHYVRFFNIYQGEQTTTPPIRHHIITNNLVNIFITICSSHDG